MKHLIILCDYGLDDAIATVALLQKRAIFKGIDIVPVGGNVPREMSFCNAQTLLSYCGAENVRLIDTSCIPQPNEYLASIHGTDGIGDVLEKKPCHDVPVLNFRDWIKTISSDSIVFSAGPCTVTAEILKNIGQPELIMMAGCIDEEPNFKGYEFNQSLDRSAFAYCAKFKHKTATLDTCQRSILNFAAADISGSGLLKKLIRASVAISQKRGLPYCYIYDYIAALYILSPDLFETEEKTDIDGNILTCLKYTGPEISDILNRL